MADTYHPNVRKFMDFLGKAEGADYNTLVGGSKFDDFSKHPQTVGLVTSEGKSTAAGKYQIIGTTYNDVAPKLGITDFSPESQDKIAAYLMERRGALKAVEEGDFTSAIGKLGKEWASLPSSPYKQPKKSMEWAMQELGIPTATKSNSQFASAEAPTPKLGGATPSTNAELDAKQKAEHGGILNTAGDFVSAIGAGASLDNSAINYYKTQALESVDPNFSWMDDDSKKALDTIPERHWDYVLQSLSAKERDARIARVQEQLATEQKLADAGMAGMAGRFVGGLSDPSTLLAFVPGLGEAALLSKTSRISNAIRMGLINAGQNAGYEALTYKYRPLGTTDDIYSSAMMGMALAAPLGFAVNPKRIAGLQEEFDAMSRAGLRENAKMQLVELEGLPMTKSGEAYKAHLSAIAQGSWRKTVDTEVETLLQGIRSLSGFLCKAGS